MQRENFLQLHSFGLFALIVFGGKSFSDKNYPFSGVVIVNIYMYIYIFFIPKSCYFQNSKDKNSEFCRKNVERLNEKIAANFKGKTMYKKWREF